MITLFNIIKTQDIAVTVKLFGKITKILSIQAGFVSGELLKVVKNINNSDYQFVSILVWENLEKYAAAKKIILKFNIFKIYEIYKMVQESTLCVPHFSAKKESKVKEAIILFNMFEINNDQIDEVYDMWINAKNYMENCDGFISVCLYKTVISTSKYKLVNIAEWLNEEFFMAALNSNGYKKYRRSSRNYKLCPSLCERVNNFII